MSENYNLDFIKIYKQIRSKTKEEKPRLLLHVCCGACSCYPLIFLADLFDITVLFTNSNIDEYEEFITRFNAARKHASLVEKTCKTRIKFVKDEYNYDTFREDLKQFPNEKEGGKRCKICITKRLNRLFEYADKNSFSYVSSIMSISRNKDAVYLNEAGKKLSERYENITFIPFDFKKNDGQDIGIEISKLEEIYRQDYCGCEFSKIS